MLTQPTPAALPVSIALMCQMLNRNSALESLERTDRIESLAMFYISKANGRAGVDADNEMRSVAFTGKVSQMPPSYPC